MKYLLPIILLSGCAAQAPKQVEIPVAISCVTNEPVAPILAYAPGSYTQVFPIVRDLKGDRELMTAYEGELLAVVKGCK